MERKKMGRKKMSKDLENLMRLSKDTKKEFHFSKDEGLWYWHAKGEPLMQLPEPFDTFYSALRDAVEPYVDDVDDVEGPLARIRSLFVPLTGIVPVIAVLVLTVMVTFTISAIERSMVGGVVAPDKHEAIMLFSGGPTVAYYNLTNVRVVDGDTLEADISLPMRVTLRQEMIRCANYDAWESSKRRRSVNVTDEEVVKGKAAAAALEALIKSGQLMVQLENDDRDVYGRVLASLYLEREGELISIAEWMEANNHIRGEINEK
jgi:endonuclease YncB( thermonuclease family)